MDEMKLKEMIEKAIFERDGKKALVLLTGAMTYSDEVIEILKGFKNLSYEWMASESSLGIINPAAWNSIGMQIRNIDTIQKTLKEVEIIIIPFLTRNTLAKTVVGIADNDITTTIQLALMMNKSIIAVDACWNPQTEKNRLMQLNKNEAYNQMLFGYREQAASFGMHSVSIYELEDVMRSYLEGAKEVLEDTKVVAETATIGKATNVAKDIITYGDIVGKEVVYVSEKSKITDLAKDYIQENNIKVVDVNQSKK